MEEVNAPITPSSSKQEFEWNYNSATMDVSRFAAPEGSSIDLRVMHQFNNVLNDRMTSYSWHFEFPTNCLSICSPVFFGAVCPLLYFVIKSSIVPFVFCLCLGCVVTFTIWGLYWKNIIEWRKIRETALRRWVSWVNHEILNRKGAIASVTSNMSFFNQKTVIVLTILPLSQLPELVATHQIYQRQPSESNRPPLITVDLNQNALQWANDDHVSQIAPPKHLKPLEDASELLAKAQKYKPPI